jgi:hypothetical protein
MTTAELVLSSRERNVRLSVQDGLLKSLSRVRESRKAHHSCSRETAQMEAATVGACIARGVASDGCSGAEQISLVVRWVVLGADRIHRSQLEQLLESLDAAGAHLFGIVMNKIARGMLRHMRTASGADIPPGSERSKRSTRAEGRRHGSGKTHSSPDRYRKRP